MPPRIVAITYGFGRRDRVDPKLAPFGVLKVGKNLRVRKDGRLGVRHGYQPLTMTTRNLPVLRAYDLFEFQGRLCALGSDASGLDYPVDTFEYLGLSNEFWRGTEPGQTKVTVNPFTNMREVAGIPQIEGGATVIDAASGGGYVFTLYMPATGSALYAMVVDAATDQTVHQERLSSTVVGKVVFSVDRFFIVTVSATDSIRLYSYRVGTNTSLQNLTSVGAGSIAVTALDMCAVTTPSTGRVAIAYDRTGVSLSIDVFDVSGSQVGSSIAVASTTTIHLAIEADQTDDTINLYTVETATDTRLRTFNFAGTLLDGPTTLTSGTSGSICRVGSVFLAIATNTSANAVALQFLVLDTHVSSGSVTLEQMAIRTRLLDASRAGASTLAQLMVVFGGLVAPSMATLERATNCLVVASTEFAHISTRDFLKAKTSQFTNLSLDSTSGTGKLCWVCGRDPGVTSRGMPVVSLVDFQSTARRQTAKYGGLLYMAGATPSIYDGRLSVEAGFQEVPGVVSVTQGSGGSLAPGATYSYISHWEYTFADGSVISSAPSEPTLVVMGASDNRNTVVVTAPHTVRVAIGDVLYGADVTAVLSRNTWEPITSTPGSIMRRVASKEIPIGMARYGDTVSFVDDMSDAVAGVQEALYTQAERGALSGPIEHDAPRACSYITATEARIITGGLSRPYETQISKGAYLGEAFAWSEFSSFFGSVSGPVIGVHRLDQARLVLTTNGIFATYGDGPDDQGGGGLGPPVEIPTPSGLRDWRSFLEAPDGLWFQLDDTKLFRMPRGGGAPSWEGVDIENTLLSYPVITAACKSKRDNAALFACENTASTDARILVRDFRTENWFEDTPVLTTSQGIEAMTSFGDRVAYVSGGAVFAQSTTSFADGTSTFIVHEAETNPLYPFGLGGYGVIFEALLTGEYRGACIITMRVSYDDGQSFTTLTAFTLTGLTVGQTIQRKWDMPQDVTSSVVFEIVVSESSGATEGFVFNQLDLLVQSEDGLRKLAPAEMA